MATLLKGGPVAQAICEKIEKNRALLAQAGVVPTLAIVRVGEHPSDLAYERGATKRAEKVGVQVKKFLLPADVPQETLVQTLEEINGDGSIHGCLMFRPLPPHLDSVAVCQTLDPEKDVDAFHPENVGRLMLGLPRFLPCTPAGIMALLRAYGISPAGKHCVVIGRSNIVGKPMALLLLAEDATVTGSGTVKKVESNQDITVQTKDTDVKNSGDSKITVSHSRTPDLAEQCRRADILISAVGRRGLITSDMVKPGAVVVDVAMNRNDAGKLCGDVDFAGVEPIASYITPVPGGVGPMTRAMLMSNIVTAARLHTK